MQDRRDGVDALTFDISYALKRAGLKLPLDTCRALAAGLVKHLRLARWEFTRRDPDPPHSAG
jgi:hypothetical protein